MQPIKPLILTKIKYWRWNSTQPYRLCAQRHQPAISIDDSGVARGGATGPCPPPTWNWGGPNYHMAPPKFHKNYKKFNGNNEIYPSIYKLRHQLQKLNKLLFSLTRLLLAAATIYTLNWDFYPNFWDFWNKPSSGLALSNMRLIISCTCATISFWNHFHYK